MGGCLAFRSHFRCIAAITIARSGLRVTDLRLLALSVCRCEIKRLSLSEVGNLEGRLGGLNKDNGAVRSRVLVISYPRCKPTRPLFPLRHGRLSPLSALRPPACYCNVSCTTSDLTQLHVN